MKRTIAIIMLTLVLAVLITGCSSNKDTTDDTTDNQVTTGDTNTTGNTTTIGDITTNDTTTTETTPAEDQQVVDEINSEIIDENQELDIGDVV